MSMITVRVEIEDGRVTAAEPGLLPRHGKGLLTLLPESGTADATPRKRVQLPLIPATGHSVNPSKEDLDASAWD